MEKSLLPGDVLVVNKLSYGPRLPITPLAIPFTSSNTGLFKDWLQLPYFRIGSTSNIEVNDVLVFNSPINYENPIDYRPVYVKRCLGLPGDTVAIENKEIFRNGDQVQKVNYEILFEYHVKTKKKIDEALLKRYQVTEGGRIENDFNWRFNLTKKMADSLVKNESISSVKQVIKKKGEWNEYVFPNAESLAWNEDYFGPFKVPAKGDTIWLDYHNFPYYEPIITDYEYNIVDIIDGKLFINDKPGDYYVFKMNYYFVLGDNRDNSVDSRYWGFLPESHIIGKASRVFYSVDNSESWWSKIRWKRIMNKIE